MNVGFEEFNTEDVAKMLGLTRCTITGWCRNGFIRYQDVSETDSRKPRYLIPESEVNRIKRLIKKYGNRKWLLYAKEDIEEEVIEHKTVEPVMEAKAQSEIKKNDEFNPDKLMNTLMYIKDIKERLEDIEAERNQLLGELELMKKEIIDSI